MGLQTASGLKRDSGRFDTVSTYGRVLAVTPSGIDIADRLGDLSVGARVELESDSGLLPAEVISVGAEGARAMAFGDIAGVRRGAKVHFVKSGHTVFPSTNWFGRVVDGLGRPIDGKGSIKAGPTAMPLRASAPPAALRARLGAQLDYGVKALTCFAPSRMGQRLGVFAAAGVGKSSLVGMIAKHTECDVCVIALIGERGREVREFIEDNLGQERFAKTILIVATSDEPAAMRREAAFLAMTVGEFFRDQGLHVMCLMDSLSRLAQAQREIGLAAGEPPTTKGYTPSVFSLLPQIIERAGAGIQSMNPGYLSGVFSVLVEGDDHDEPIADAARAMLDGHIVLSRRIAESGRMPAVDILKSVSRVAGGVLSSDREALIKSLRADIAVFEEMREMIRIGAYKPGTDPAVDRAISVVKELEIFLQQSPNQCVRAELAFDELARMAEKGTGT